MTDMKNYKLHDHGRPLDRTDLSFLNKEFRTCAEIKAYKLAARIEYGEESDRYLYLEQLEVDAMLAYSQLNKDLQKFVDLYFWGEKSYYEVSDIAEELYYSKRQIYRREDKILITFAKVRGYL